eukprot:s313_g17.t3
MEDSPQLSGLLLHRFGNGLAGKSLLDFCCKEDHNRILEHFESSLVKGAPVMALHVDMLDSDQNHLKVELLHARFANLSNERCFLIGVREIQYMDAGPAPLNQSSFQQLRPVEPVGFVHDLMLTFDVPTFEILSLSSSLEGLCGQMAMEKVESILDISSTQGPNPRRGVENTLWFNLLGLGNVIASVVMEHDELLDTFVGTMQIHGPLELQRFQRGIAEGTAETLTEANVQQLEQPRHRPLRSLRSVSRSSRSTSERSARGSRPVTSRVRTAPSSGSYGSHGAQRCSGARELPDWCHPNLYRVLGIRCDFPTAEDGDELKRAYKRRSLQFHPDKPGGSAVAFQRIADAHHVLLDPEKRKAFDEGADFPRKVEQDGSEGETQKEEVEKKYFPENFDFQPFGDPHSDRREAKARQEKHLEQRRQEALAREAHQTKRTDL